jgi:hypothetical protein
MFLKTTLTLMSFLMRCYTVSEITKELKRQYTECPKNGVLTVHYGVEEISVNARKM